MVFGHKGLDKLLTIEPGIVTGIVGKAGTGKTSLALVIAKNTKKPYLIDTEGVSLERIKQIGSTHLRIAKVRDFGKQQKLITSLRIEADLLIVDSLVMLYRLLLTDDHKKANAMLSKQIAHLSWLANEMEIPVIVTGHVYTTEEGTKVVGGDIMKYWTKTLVFIEKTGLGRRKATLIKHRSLPEGKSCTFKLCNRGVC
ncbi:MAG: AAA family ATPase [Candidatus Altiarchaeota archaeon]|nr:AAA family ATPase [Candidatus Altiarchaeota archaeon]